MTNSEQKQNKESNLKNLFMIQKSLIPKVGSQITDRTYLLGCEYDHFL